MNRPKRISVAVWAPALLIVAIVATTTACSAPPEQTLLRQFFRASQLRDNATLAGFAATSFNPRTDGSVSSFDIVSISDEQRQPLRLKDLAMAVQEAVEADDTLGEEMRAYQQENLPAIERVLKAEASKSDVARRDQEVQKTWQDWRNRSSASAKAVSDARQALGNRRPIIELSVANLGDAPLDLTTVDGEVVMKEVTIDAEVRPPDSEDAESRQLVVTIERAEINAPAGGEPIVGRWIVTRVAGA